MKHLKIDLHKAWDIIKKYEHPSKEARDRIALLAGFQTWALETEFLQYLQE